MEQSIHAYVVSKLQASKGRWPEVAEGSKVPLSTVRKVAQQSTKAPRIDTLERLAGYFRQLDSEHRKAS